MRTRPLALTGLAVVGLLAAGIGLTMFLHRGDTPSVVEQWIPPRPDTSGFPAALNPVLDAAEARARSRSAPSEGLEELSRLYHANGFYDEAIHCYTGLEQLEPTNARWPHLHATIIAGFGLADEALALWQTAVRLDPNYLPARLRSGDVALKASRLDAAAAAYADVLELDAENPYALLGLARIDLERGRVDETRIKLETVVRWSEFTLGYDLLVSVYEKAGLTAQATALRAYAGKASGTYQDPPDPWLDGLIDHCYDPFRLALAAGARERRGDKAGAIDLLQRAVELEPTDVTARYQLGNIYLEQGRTAEAIDAFRSCTIQDPGFSDGWGKLSAAIAQTGDVAAAEQVIEQGLAAIPDSPGLHRMRARRHWSRGDLGATIADYRTAIRLRPNDPGSYIELGMVMDQQGRTREAAQLFETALVYDPANPTALTGLARRDIEVGDRAAADDLLRRIADQPRTSQEQINFLREAYRRKFGEYPRR